MSHPKSRESPKTRSARNIPKSRSWFGSVYERVTTLPSLQIMRLTRPTFAPSPSVPMEPDDVGYDAMKLCLDNVTGQSNVMQSFTSALLLPQSFDNIYLGETFLFYVCVHNDSQHAVTQVSIKADLQTSSQRASLPSKYAEPVYTLQPGETLGEVISHEVKEIGQHILVCAVSYLAVERMHFRKFFKFPVAKPLDVRTKFYNAESDDVYFEAQIQNMTQAPIVMERVALEPSKLYTVNELNVAGGLPAGAVADTTPTADADVDTVDKQAYVSVGDVRQYLYRLSPVPDVPIRSYRGVTTIGKLDIIWRSNMGERGRLQTSQLQRMAPGYGDLRVSIVKVPCEVQLYSAFTIVCRLFNCCDRALDLLLVLEGALQPALVWCSKSNTRLGVLAPQSSLDITLELVPLTVGLLTISGIRLTDTFLKRTYEHDEIAQIFVTGEEEGLSEDNLVERQDNSDMRQLQQQTAMIQITS